MQLSIELRMRKIDDAVDGSSVAYDDVAWKRAEASDSPTTTTARSSFSSAAAASRRGSAAGEAATKAAVVRTSSWRGGFALDSMEMWDADAPRGASSRWRWRGSSSAASSEEEEEVAHLPASILRCRAVTRRMGFSTVEPISALRVVQTVRLHGATLEVWTFDCGFVIPGSSNSWDHTIAAAPSDDMIDVSILSGNVVVESVFSDVGATPTGVSSGVEIGRISVRLFYE